jgi:HK97 family phage major capsid protein
MKRVTDELMAKRANALKNMQDIRDQAKDGVMDADQTAKFQAAEKEFDLFDEQIKSLRKLETAEAAQEQMENVMDGKDAERKGFVNFIRTGDKSGIKIDNAMSTGSGAPARSFRTISTTRSSRPCTARSPC